MNAFPSKPVLKWTGLKPSCSSIVSSARVLEVLAFPQIGNENKALAVFGILRHYLVDARIRRIKRRQAHLPFKISRLTQEDAFAAGRDDVILLLQIGWNPPDDVAGYTIESCSSTVRASAQYSRE